jgi:hypothetical protein
MSALDPFTQRRLLKFISDFRSREGELPTLRDLEQYGFSKDAVDSAIKQRLIEMLYVTMTNGSIVKGFKIVVSDPFPQKD